MDSLDPANDLKPGDIRKMLIDYSLNPESVTIANAKIEAKAESPFESAVARFLTVRGYHLVQQWKVGAYRLDMVAVCGRKKVAIECDGERWHSGEDKIREDMERQTILDMQDDKPEQMMFPGMKEPAPDAEDIIALLEITGTQYVDKRANGGSLWIIGGYELSETVRKAKVLGFTFHFKKEGGRATRNQPGWWAK